MGFSSQSGQIIVRSQAVLGTYQVDTGTAGVGVKIKSGSLGSNRDLLIADAEIGGGRDVVDGYLGAVSWGGDYDFYARSDVMATFLKACLGMAAAPVTTTGATTHTITPVDSGTLPLLSIEENIGGTLETYQYTDVVVNTLHLESDANGYLTAKVGLIAAKQLAGAIKTTAAVKFDDTPMFVGTNIGLTFNSISLPAKKFTLDINNNIDDKDFRLGSFYIGDLTAKRREVAATFNIRESSSALWRQATYGLSSAVSPGGVVTHAPLVITMSSYEDIPGATPAGTKYKLIITIPSFVLKPYTLSASGDDVIEDDISGQGVRPTVGTPVITAAVVTGATGAVIA